MEINSILTKLPHSPGIYKFFNKEDQIIYIGKAKNLKNRVSSYFNKSNQHNRKTLQLISQISKLEFTLVNTEFDALLLENNLIKKHQPKYNILLKDDKTYPYLCITKECFPKLIPTRHLDKTQGTFYGPYSNLKAMYTLLDLLKKVFTIRSCTYNLTDQNITKNKFKVCLEYHIGNCKGPCERLQTEEDYLKDIEQIHQILKGNTNWAINYFKNLMAAHAENLDFEQAQKTKEKLELLQNFQNKSLVANPSLTDIDVCTITSDEKKAYINFLEIKNGSVIHTHNLEITKKLDETDIEILTLAYVELRNLYQTSAKEVISNLPLQEFFEKITNTLPKIGDKKNLLDLSLKNALYLKKQNLEKNLKAEQKENRVLVTLQKDLRLKELPFQIECFDNSNIQGTNPVAAMVCFKNGVPSKKDYRHFNIKTVVGPDDFASMYEIVTRRYKRVLEESLPLPQLIIIDGGKGQLSAACNALKDLKIYGQIPIVGIAKKLEEIYFPEDPFPLHIAKKSESLKLIQRIRDEAHRFAINFHRDKRSKGAIHTELEDIKGVGENTIKKLFSELKTVEKIKNSTLEELATHVGKAKANIVFNYFHKTTN